MVNLSKELKIEQPYSGMKNKQTVSVKTSIKENVGQIVANATTRDEKLFQICELLEQAIPVFDWVGFYLVDPNADRQLVLGPFVGEPTEHTRIPFGKGICGQAANTHQTFVVQDVAEASNYLACSVQVKAEIVVPVMKEETFVAELDIDSHTKNSITQEYRQMLEEVCNIVSDLF